MSKHSLMSVKYFSRLLVPDGDEAALAKMMRQVRHWTALDLLRTAGPKATGTGVSRVYDEDELYKAVILEELVRVGVPAAFMEENEFGEWLDLNKGMEHWQSTKNGDVDVFLNMASEADGGVGTIMSKDPSTFLRYLNHAQNQPKQVNKGIPMPKYTSLILLNVTALFQKVPK
ncbi:MAG: hypothetical protein ABJO09_06440 [Hyphomicrobiales bacterium]